MYLEHAPTDVHRPDALRWKAGIYEHEDIPRAAFDIYREVATQYPDDPAHDIALLDAARMALEVGSPEDAVTFLTELLQKYPASPMAGQGKLLLGDAYRDAGNPAQARTIYTSIAQLSPNAAQGAKAQARLAEIALEEGKPDEAISLLESRISAATSIEGNDEVLLTLAKAYRAANRLEDALRSLTDLLDFMPESVAAPPAYDELTQLLSDMNQPEQALRTAREAAAKFPDDPDILRNLGELLRLGDEKREAAQLLVAAHEKGASDPDLLLTAARLFRDVGAEADAEATYRKILAEYPMTPQSFESEIDLAEQAYEQGAYQKGLRQLEDLALATPEGPSRLPVLLALGTMYEELGVNKRVGEIYGEIAALSSEPQVLARAAVSLFDANAWDEGAAVAGRVDASQLPEDLAYTFLTTYGEAMLQASPVKAVPLLEQAYRSYPTRRTQEGRALLFDACLLAEKLDGARSVLIDLQDEAALNAAETPRLIKAATKLGDYYYGRREYGDAAAAYEQAAQADDAATSESLWALYERANALLQMSDFEKSLEIFERVAVAAVPFSRDARIKADYIRLEMRMRGLPSEPPPPARTG
jgi:tetratricopeptide (TPR) repeat protein